MRSRRRDRGPRRPHALAPRARSSRVRRKHGAHGRDRPPARLGAWAWTRAPGAGAYGRADAGVHGARESPFVVASPISSVVASIRVRFVSSHTAFPLPLERPSPPLVLSSSSGPCPVFSLLLVPIVFRRAAHSHRPQPSGAPPEHEDVYAPPPPSYEPKGEPLPPPAGAPPPSGPPPRFEDSV
jgi:hypothetical protein